MSILSYFDHVNNGCFILKLQPKERDAFLSKLPNKYRKCYITDQKIEELLSRHNGNISAKKIIQSKIPDPGSVMAGDFGEITAYFILKGKYLPIKLFGPKKWRWKNDRNKALLFTDVIMFDRNDTPSEKDLVVLAEVKTKSTKRTKNPIQQAIEGVQKDYVSRFARTLIWLKDIYTSVAPNAARIEYLDRFINSQEDKYGKYTKHFKAVAIIDSSFLDNDLEENIEDLEIEDDFEVIVISIDDLKTAYESTYKTMLQTYE